MTESREFPFYHFGLLESLEMLFFTDKNIEFFLLKRLKKLFVPKKRAKDSNIKDLEPEISFFNFSPLESTGMLFFTDNNKEFSLFKLFKIDAEGKKRAKDPNLEDLKPGISFF